MILDICFVVIWLLMPLFWHLLIKMAHLDYRKLTMPILVILFFYLFQYVGIPILFFQLDEYRYAEGVNDKILMLEVFLYTAYTISLMLIGFVVGNRVLGDLHPYGDNYVGIWGDVSEKISKMTKLLIFALLMICVGVLVKYVLKVGLDNIALVQLFGLSDNSASLAISRSDMGNNFSGKYHWYYLFMNKLMLFINYIVFAIFLLKPTTINKVFFLALTLITSFSLMMATEKAPLVLFFLGLFLVFTCVRNNGNVQFKNIIKVGLFILIVLIIFYINFMGESGIIRGISSIISRTFSGQIQSAYHYLEYIPEYQDFLLGRSFPNPGGIFPFTHFPLTMEVMAWHNPIQAEQGVVVGSMPTIFWAEMHANFGIVGVLAPPFFVGFTLYWMNSLINRCEANAISVAFFVWLTMHMKDLAASPLSNYVVDIYLIVTLAVYLLLLLVNGGGRFAFRQLRR